MSTTDRIEKRVTLRAPQSRVWRALSDAGEFGAWFGVTLDGPLEEGATTRGRFVKANCGHDDLTLEVRVERMQPEGYLAFRWHPYAIDPAADYSAEPMTLVEFRLTPAGEGTLLTIVESGFDRIPLARRAEAFRMNDGGWTIQAGNIERHVSVH